MASAGKPHHYLIIVENLPVPFDRRVWMEATTLREAGYEVSVICPKGRGFEADHEDRDGIHIYRHDLPPDISSTRGYLHEYAAALRGEWRLARRIWRERPFDAIHLCNPPDLLFLIALWFKLRHGVKVVFDHHDPVPEMFLAKFGRKNLFYYAVCLAERITYRVADLAIATNQSHRDIAVRRGGKKPEDVYIVRSGPDLSRFREVAPDPSLKRGRPYLVGYVGVMGEPEGIDLLLRAVAHLVHTLGRTDIQFTLVGSGPLTEQLKCMATDLKIDDWVTFTGRLPDAEMLTVLCTADLCVNPDRKNAYNDLCTMNKTLEYMALGKAVVQFDLIEGRRSAGEASIYAKDNDTGDLARCLVELLDDPERRAVMGAAGRRRMVEQLEWQHQRRILLKAVGRLISEGPR